MTIDSPTLMASFFDLFKDKYPGISQDEMKKVCIAEFDMIRRVMSEGNLEEIRLQYLFTLKPSVPKIIKSLESLHTNRSKGRVSVKDFEKYNTMFRNYIEQNPDKFLKYKERIENVDRKRDNN